MNKKKKMIIMLIVAWLAAILNTIGWIILINNLNL